MATGSAGDINLIKRAMNISSNYYYNILSVPRLNRLYYPPNAPLQCRISII